MRAVKSIVILISGRGSNMDAILDAGLPLTIKAVISNRPDASGLVSASQRGVTTRVVDHKSHASREAFDAALANTIDRFAPDYIVLAGFMRVLTEGFVNRYPQRILNIHPSLLPAFPVPRLDHGPVIVQAAVPVLPGDDEAALGQRVLAVEHQIYPQALRWLAEGRVVVNANGVVEIRDLDVSSSIGTQAILLPKE